MEGNLDAVKGENPTEKNVKEAIQKLEQWSILLNNIGTLIDAIKLKNAFVFDEGNQENLLYRDQLRLDKLVYPILLFECLQFL
jgi:hypothetical protein